jgi:ABC-type branched-subunit amino acid transport system substrate-binding protein
MAISETSLKDVALMTIEEINNNGGVMGRKIEPIVVDPASNWPLFAEKARQLLTQDKVAVVFGCWTSVSRKSVLPVFEELRQTRFFARFSTPKGFRMPISLKFIRPSGTATIRTSLMTSRNSHKAAKRL